MVNNIKTHLLNNSHKLIPQRCNKNYLKKHKLYEFINNSFDDTYSLSEKIYCLVNDLKERKRCKVCNKELKFKNGKYSTYCSRKCSNSDPEVLKKNKIGVSHSLKKAYEKRGDEIKQKRSNTLLKNFGEYANSPFEITSIKNKAKQTILNKYGVKNVFYIKKFRSNVSTAQDKSVIFNKLNGYDIIYLDKNKILVKNLCDIHGDVVMDSITFYNRAHRNRNGIICPICNPINSFSSLEKGFIKLLSEINVTKYKKNTKDIIAPYELDFYFPNKKIAFELNGLYWHSEIYKDSNYHKNKSDLCAAKDIQLIHIWEDDFYEKYDLIKSVVSSKLGITPKRIYARKCKIKKITSKNYRLFLDDNHLQGSINSSIRLGLFYNNKLVSVMGFGKARISLGTKQSEGIYELHRFCSKKYYTIVGGASKLFNYFEKNFKYDKIISYAKRDYSNGNLYRKLNFEFVHNTSPGYYWVIDNKRKHRFNYRKDQIQTNENKHLTAVEIMHNKNYFRCYDSGNMKFVKYNKCIKEN